MKEMYTRPLYGWVFSAAAQCKLIDKFYLVHDFINTSDGEDPQLKGFYNLRVSEMDDFCLQEDRMIPFAKEHDFKHIVLLQATSPLLTSEDLTEGITMYLEGKYDSLVSVVKQKRLLWGMTNEGHTYPLNYNPSDRDRKKNADLIVENGAFFITSREALLKSNSRTSGNVGLYFMPEDTYYEVDDPLSWDIVEMLLKRRLQNG